MFLISNKLFCKKSKHIQTSIYPLFLLSFFGVKAWKSLSVVDDDLSIFFLHPPPTKKLQWHNLDIALDLPLPHQTQQDFKQKRSMHESFYLGYFLMSWYSKWYFPYTDCRKWKCKSRVFVQGIPKIRNFWFQTVIAEYVVYELRNLF